MQACVGAGEVHAPGTSESDDEVPDLVDCSMPEYGRVWFAVLVGRVPGVFNMRSVRSFMRAIFFYNDFQVSDY